MWLLSYGDIETSPSTVRDQEDLEQPVLRRMRLPKTPSITHP
ncbi:hypothetical protein GDO86_010480 [Hymenochirus boettgeri]|uniref:Uncharacterized protein n=1 Tax=Hymenochirus boettgeri TaxID=247094 RepID=A0A8T2JQN4_9PIPI|nr:hypothetical protein GDO86_010480 [Hymenochirus boettgeri]